MLDAKTAAQLFDKICGKTILVIGDLMLDRFIDGKVERISPEAPVPILSKSTSTTMPGGAANVARNICQMGAHCHLLGITGDDEAARELAQALSSRSGLTFHAHKMPDRPTTTKTRFRSGMQQIMRLDDEVTTPLDSNTSEALIAQALPLIDICDLVVLSDYAKGCLTDEVIGAVINHAKKAGIKVIIDPKSDDFARYKGAFLATPNLAELRKATVLTNESDDAISAGASSLAEANNISHILTTLSARGMRLDGSGKSYHIPSLTKDVFDVSGAGDTVVASLACAISSGETLETAMLFANQAASIVVSKPGTAAYSAGEMIAACSTVYEAKTSLSDHQEMIESWRKDGLKIGFTNGCFDNLHAGHMHVLREAAKRCDKLIIGVNSDESVKRLKGPSRPIQNQDQRAFVLASLAECDGVILFEDETPAALIETLLPDVLIKGGDYQPQEIVGYECVTKKGGDVMTIALLSGHSTTAFLKG